MKISTFHTVKKWFLVICLIISIATVRAQSFNITGGTNPPNTITDTIPCTVSEDLTFYVNNLTSDNLELKWKVITNTLPIAHNTIAAGGCWFIATGDWEMHGITPSPVGVENNPFPIPAYKDSMRMDLFVDPEQIKGSGKLVIEIYEASNPSGTTQTITWNVTGCTTGSICTVGIIETADNTRFIVYPNPAEEFITMELVKGCNRPIGSVQIYNMVGEMLLEFNEVKSNTLKMDVSALPAGAYFIKRNDKDGVSVKRFFKIK